jgi:uncharacterized SAM-binding protein YcdF (DUF218 family)
MRKLCAALIAGLLLAVLLPSTSGAFLIVNDPQKSDVIVVLAGETDRRPARGLELIRQSYAPRLLLDVPQAAKIFDRDTIDIAQNYVEKLPEHERIAICPISGLSTKTEAQNVAGCLRKMSAKRILLVTSDYHTRRALSTFRHELPDYEFSVAATADITQFDPSWWKRRQWAKINFDEWLKLTWWNAVDRWRK